MNLSFLARIPDLWKAIGVMAAVFIGGLALGTSAIGWAQLPKRLESLEVRADELEQDHETVKSELRHMRSLIQQQLCLSVAEKRRTPWQDCLQEKVK